MYLIDDIDQAILEELKQDCRKTFTQVAKDLDISNSLVHQRVKKMIQAGLIARFEVRLNPKALGYQTQAYTGIMLKDGKYSYPVADELRKIPEVVECNFVTGKYALFAKILARDNDHLREILYDKIDYIEGVVGTESFVAFGSEFDRQIPVSRG